VSSVRKPTLTTRCFLYDAKRHGCSRNRARNWVLFRIWRSRCHFLSTPPARKTAIVPFLTLSRTMLTGASAMIADLPATCPDQTVRCRRRHQPRRPPLAKIKPGRPAPAIGPGTGIGSPAEIDHDCRTDITLRREKVPRSWVKSKTPVIENDWPGAKPVSVHCVSPGRVVKIVLGDQRAPASQPGLSGAMSDQRKRAGTAGLWEAFEGVPLCGLFWARLRVSPSRLRAIVAVMQRCLGERRWSVPILHNVSETRRKHGVA